MSVHESDIPLPLSKVPLVFYVDNLDEDIADLEKEWVEVLASSKRGRGGSMLWKKRIFDAD